MLTRRNLLDRSARIGAALSLAGCTGRRDDKQSEGFAVNDVQSQLNATHVREIAAPSSIDDVRSMLRSARRRGRSVSVAGGRHAMGGQQFGAGAVHLDTTRFNRVIRFDKSAGQIEVEAG